MRVYEYAKEKGVSNKELIGILSKGGFTVASHMSVLTSDAVDFLNKSLQPAPSPSKSVPQPITQKSPMPPSTQKITSPSPIAAPIIPPPSTAPAIPKNIPPFKKEIEPKESAAVQSTTITLAPMMLADFAAAINKPFTDVIFTLLKWKILSNKNLLLSAELVQRLAEHYQIATARPEVPKETAVTTRKTAQNGSERLPIVVVMGHVDHGKTTLLDFIRKTRVAAREKGGITQHLGAYEAKTPQGSIVFLDTPGHEAFSKIRMRGARVADITVLVVAVDDGIMPQTIEAIKQAQAMNTPIIVALNKIDKGEGQRIEVIKHELSQQFNLLPEEWGGSTMYIPLSAKMGTNVDKLLEMILLQSHVMELKADPAQPAKGYVIESKVEKGLGTVATFIAQHGTIRVGDYFICGSTRGKVSALIDSFGTRVALAGPSVPVQVSGFEQAPEAGDYCEVVNKEEYARVRAKPEISKVGLIAQSKAADAQSIKIIVKTDAASSQEALVEGIVKLSKKLERGYTILLAAIGNVSDSDVVLAADTSARIITLHVKTEPSALSLAQQMGVVVLSYDIIYKLLESLEEYSNSLRAVKMVRKKIGQAVVRKVFDIKGLGVIAGCYVREGIFTRDGTVEVWRGSKKIGEGAITSLQRDRKSVKEVHSGFECAFMIKDFSEWEVDDRVECFAQRPESAAKQ